MAKSFTPQQIDRWEGIPQDFADSSLSFALSLEGLKNARLLRQAGYQSLRKWVDDQIADINEGLREMPSNYIDIPKDAPEPPAAKPQPAADLSQQLAEVKAVRDSINASLSEFKDFIAGLDDSDTPKEQPRAQLEGHSNRVTLADRISDWAARA